jgi:hypothetical protein
MLQCTNRAGHSGSLKNQEQTMSENQTKVQQITSKVEKVVAAVGARIETAVAELNTLQAKGVEQAKTFTESATRATHEQLAFAEQMGSEWRKLVLGATRTATEFFTPKA